MRKPQDSLMITFNKTDGSTFVVKRKLQGEKTFGISGGITVKSPLPSSTRRWVIKMVHIKLSSAEIKQQPQKEKFALKIETAARIIDIGNKPSKAVIITTEGSGCRKPSHGANDNRNRSSSFPDCRTVCDVRGFGTPLPIAAARRRFAVNALGPILTVSAHWQRKLKTIKDHIQTNVEESATVALAQDIWVVRAFKTAERH